MLESLVSCGTAPSCLHWQRTSCSGSSKVVLQCLIMSGGIPSLPGASPDAKLSMALLSYSFDGSESNSSMVGRHSVRYRAACGRHSVLSGIEITIVFYPSLHLLAFVCDYLPTRGFEGGRLALGRTQCLLNAIVHSPDVPCYVMYLYEGWAVSNSRLRIASRLVEPCPWQLWEYAGFFRMETVCRPTPSGRCA